MGPTPGTDFAAALVDRHGSAVRRYVAHAVHRTSAADDLVQEAFLRIVRAVGRYDPRERERAWVFRIAHNVVVDHYREMSRSVEGPMVFAGTSRPTHALGTELNAALDALAADDRDAFLLAEVGGLTYAEIGSTTGSTVAAVRSRVYRARIALRERLSPPAPLAPAAVPVEDDDD